MATTPFKDSELSRFVSKRILELRPKSQTEIAAEAGFPNANFVSMLKSGVSKLAIDRVPALAHALECDPAYLMRLALEQEVGSTAAKALVEILGTPVSANERLWLDEIRGASGNSDPRPATRARTAIRSVFGK
jgi:transcriptional regulator with XRE-family HTH domain